MRDCFADVNSISNAFNHCVVVLSQYCFNPVAVVIDVFLLLLLLFCFVLFFVVVVFFFWLFLFCFVFLKSCMVATLVGSETVDEFMISL